MTAPPVLSVITVCRNDVAALRRTWESLKNQHKRALCEWIVIDGASSDETPEFLVSLKKKDFKPAFWSSKPDNGLYDAMNTGIEKASGHYLFFLNAGDTLADELTIEFLSTTITRFGADFVYGDSFEKTAQGVVYHKKARNHTKPEYGLFTHHQAMLYKRDAVQELRYDMRYNIAADYDFTLRFLQQTDSVHYLPEPICIFESGGISHKNAALGRHEQFEIRRALNLVPPVKNRSIFILQFFYFMLRRHLPFLYWKMKR